MKYNNIIKQCEDSKYLISMVSLEEIIRLGHSLNLKPQMTVLDLCCGYGTMLKIWNEAFDIEGTGVDLCKEFIEIGQKRLIESNIESVHLVVEDVLNFECNIKYDVVVCSETFETIEKTLALGQKYLNEHGVLIYCKTFSKIDNPPDDLVEFEGELLTLNQLNDKFNELGYFITHLATDSDSDWERYVTSEARKNLENIRRKPEDSNALKWSRKWNEMYYKYRRNFEGQALFGLEKI